MEIRGPAPFMSTNPLNSRAPSGWVLWNGSLSRKSPQVKQYNKCINETLKLLHEIRNTNKKELKGHAALTRTTQFIENKVYLIAPIG
jgi:hypothetical protein